MEGRWGRGVGDASSWRETRGQGVVVPAERHSLKFCYLADSVCVRVTGKTVETQKEGVQGGM